MRPPHRRSTPALVLTLALAACGPGDAPLAPAADPPPTLAEARPGPAADMSFDLAAPVFGLDAAPDGSLLATEAFSGLVEIRKGDVALLAEIVNPTGVDAVGRGVAWVVSGQVPELPGVPGAEALYRVDRGTTRMVADLHHYEHTVNPDQVWNPGEPDSNPFNVAALGAGAALVADAAANAILFVDGRGGVDWVAVLPPIPLAFGAGQIPAQPVATSIAVGPDGAWYAGELTGFPGTPGHSRVWRIAPGTRHTVCPSDACEMVLDGLTSIVDLDFGHDGTLYAVELDAAGWLATQTAEGVVPAEGGRVKACDVHAGTCQVVADGLDLPAALAVGKDGTLWVAENGSIPGAARVRALGG